MGSGILGAVNGDTLDYGWNRLCQKILPLFVTQTRLGEVLRSDRSILEQAGLASGLLTEDQLDNAWQTLVESLPVSNVSLEDITDRQLASHSQRSVDGTLSHKASIA